MILQNFPSLPRDFQQVLSLAEQQNDIEILPLEELKGGRTGAKLFLVSISGQRFQRISHLILKLDHIHKKAPRNESENHRLARDLSPAGFAEQHLPEIAFESQKGDAIAIFYTIAGQSLLSYRALASFERQDQLETIFSITNDVLLDQWNADLEFEQGCRPCNLLERWLGYRLTSSGNLNSFLQDVLKLPDPTDGFLIQDQVFPNPLFYCCHPDNWGAVRPLDAILGYIHGDLNITNILAKFNHNNIDLEGYYLIDFALFKEQMPLIFDQRYLEVSYLIRELEHCGFQKWVHLVSQYAKQDLPSPHEISVDLTGACSVINRGRQDFMDWVQVSHASLYDDLWGQFWLAGVAAGMNYCNKAMLGIQERLGALIYAAAHLKRFADQFDLSRPTAINPLPDPDKITDKGQEFDLKSASTGEIMLDEIDLPVYASPLIGRKQEMLELYQLLEDHRLVTITGPGGIGKTRIALAVTEASKDRYSQGAFFIPLLSTKSPIGIIPAIANTIGLTFLEGRPPRDQLLDHIKNRHMLLVLDNLEHLLGAPHKAETLNMIELLLRTAPQIRILATSRELLRLADEQPFLIHGLNIGKDEKTTLSPEESAVTLFLERTKKILTNGDSLSGQDLTLVRRICRFVDGLPLAIELAAAQLRLLTLEEVSRELSSSLEVLDTGMRGSGSRHASMRSVFESSWRSLDNQDQQIFARLSVFRGGFDLRAASHVAQVGVTSLALLLDKSLIQKQAGERFTLHPLIQMFASEKLHSMPQLKSETNKLHFYYYQQVLEGTIREWRETSSPRVMDRLQPDADNLVAAWDWIMSRGDWEASARYLENLWQFFKVQGRLSEIMEIIAKAIQAGQSTIPAADKLHLAHWRRRLGQAHLWMSQLEQGEKNFRLAITLLDRPLPASRREYLPRILWQILVQIGHRIAPGFVETKDKKQRELYHEAFIAYEQLAERAIIENDTFLIVFCVLRGLNLSENAGAPSLKARAYATSGFLSCLVNLDRLSKIYLGWANEIIRKDSPPESREWVLRMSGYYHGTVGEINLAEKDFTLAANLAGELGQNWIQELSWTGLLYSAYYQADFERAQYFARRIRTNARLRGDAGFEAAADYWEAAVKIQQSQFPEAIDLLKRAAAAPQDMMMSMDWIILYTTLAQAYQRQGYHADAQEESDRVLALITQISRPSNALLLCGYSGCAEVKLALWETEAPTVSAQQLKRSAGLACRKLNHFARVARCATTHAHLRQGLYDWLNGNRKEAYTAWQRGMDNATKMKFLFDQALLHYEIGRHLSPGESSFSGWSSQRHLQQAIDIFADLEAPYHFTLATQKLNELEY
ncbi:MAG: AAA family ATPase [Chloroflexota bacterium]|nr:MAG: AAA family ATPase [Chloroflexota bacterium]